MATAITLQDIIDAIDAEPEMLDALRARLLTRELIELPEKFAKFQASTLAFMDSMQEFKASTQEFMASTREFMASTREFMASTREFQASMQEFKDATEKRLDGMDRRFDGVDRRFDGVDRRFDGVDRRFSHLTVQVNRLNGWVASLSGSTMAAVIIRRMGYRNMRALIRDELVDMTHNCDTTGIRPGDLDSFVLADAVVEATDGEGRKRYVAIEFSYTAGKRDTARAIRNAGFLARFTGFPASAVVAGIQMADEIRDEVDAGDVFWHELPMRVLQPE